MAIFSLFLNENICCGVHWASNEYPRHLFSSRNKKIRTLEFLLSGVRPIDFPPIINAIPLTEGQTSVYGTIRAEVCPRNSTSI